MSAPKRCIDLAAKIVIKDGKLVTCPVELHPFIYQLGHMGLKNQKDAADLLDNWLNIGWIPPFVAAEMTMDGMDTAFQAKQVAKLEEDNEALRFEVEQLRATMKQMTDWHNKIDDWLKVREEKVSK